MAEAPEGKVMTYTHKTRERNRKIVANKKTQFFDRHKKLFCQACSFNYYETYGSRGENFIECHHIKPLSQLEPDEITTLDDLMLICANCHRMIHRKSPWLTPDQLDTLLKAGPYPARGV